MQQIIQQIQVIDQSKDNWHYIWGDSTYSSSKFYHLSYKNIQPLRPFIWIWDSRCANKFKVFPWFLLRDILSVRDILRRRKMQTSRQQIQLCVLSGELWGNDLHLFFAYQFSERCWSHLGIGWCLDLPFHAMMEEAKRQTNHNFFMEFFIIVAWTIWKERNDIIFNRGTPSFQSLALFFGVKKGQI
jgi:hypothetical protein